MERASVRNRVQAIGMGQLTLVEHALCPLDSRQSLVENLVHQSRFGYSNEKRQRRTGLAKVFCPLGLSSSDEFYLWGLLALTLGQTDPEPHLSATPHWCLRQLGLVDSGSRRGGRQYRRFSDAIRRLSAVHYLNDAFYDPVRKEHRRVSFGFFSYSLPQDPKSSRAWQLAWDPLFFELLSASAGHFRFDLEMYRQLDDATRRLFLFASKILYRRRTLPNLPLQKLAVDVLGTSKSMATRDMKVKVDRCLQRLRAQGVLTEVTITRTSPGEFIVRAARGPYFEDRKREEGLAPTVDCPLMETLVELGCQPPAARRLIRRYGQQAVRQWVDITQAAQERFGNQFFKRSPIAFLVDSLKASAAGTRTPPDWWQDIRREEARSQSLSEESRQVFERLRDQVFPSPSPPKKKPSGSVGLAADVLRSLAEVPTK